MKCPKVAWEITKSIRNVPKHGCDKSIITKERSILGSNVKEVTREQTCRMKSHMQKRTRSLVMPFLISRQVSQGGASYDWHLGGYELDKAKYGEGA